MKKCLPASPLIIRVLKHFARWHRKYLGKMNHPSSLASMSHDAIFAGNSTRQAGEEKGALTWQEQRQRQLDSVQLGC